MTKDKTISEAKMYRCNVCGQAYSTIEGLTLHNHYSWEHNPELNPNHLDKTISKTRQLRQRRKSK